MNLMYFLSKEDKLSIEISLEDQNILKIEDYCNVKAEA